MNAMTPFEAVEIAPRSPFAAPRTRQEKTPARRNPADYAGILEKHDDRLIEDIGLTREEILGPERSFWSDWLKIKTPWHL